MVSFDHLLPLKFVCFYPNPLRDSNRAHGRRQKKRFIPEKSFTSARFLKGCFHLFSVKFFPFPSKTFLYSLFSYLQNRIEKKKKKTSARGWKSKLDLDVLRPLFEAASIDLLTLTIATGPSLLIFLKRIRTYRGRKEIYRTPNLLIFFYSWDCFPICYSSVFLCA